MADVLIGVGLETSLQGENRLYKNGIAAILKAQQFYTCEAEGIGKEETTHPRGLANREEYARHVDARKPCTIG